jgi:hypothetical protein
MTFKNRTDVPFIGGPLAGTVASNSRVIYRDAIDGRPCRWPTATA